MLSLIIHIEENSMKVREFKTTDGTPTALIFDDNKPVFWANYWLINLKRQVRPKSLITYSYDICIVMLFFRYKKIDYIKRFREGKFLTNGELSKLRNCLMEPKNTIERRISGLGFINQKKVCNSAYDRRCRLAKPYLLFLAEELLVDTKAVKGTAIVDFSNRLEKQLRSSNSSDGNCVEPWTQDDYTMMDRAIKHNFNRKSKFLLHRDLVLFHLLRELGVRNSELLGITIDCFDRKKQGYVTVRIELNSDLSTDPRSSPATVKTLNRELKISDALWTLIERYIIERNKIKSCIKHNFLIIGISGAPLSNDAVGKVFNLLSSKTKRKINPHSLRHSWACNFILREYEKASGFTGHDRERIISNALSILRVQMGWSLRSKMPEHYARYAFQKIGNDRLFAEDNILNTKLMMGNPHEKL
jgi:hypothetical protein